LYTIVYFEQENKYIFVYNVDRNKVHLSVQYSYKVKQDRPNKLINHPTTSNQEARKAPTNLKQYTCDQANRAEK